MALEKGQGGSLQGRVGMLQILYVILSTVETIGVFLKGGINICSNSEFLDDILAAV